MRWPWNKKPERRDADPSWSALIPSGTAAGIPVSPGNAETISTVFSCVQSIAETIGGLPLLLYRNEVNGDRIIGMIALDLKKRNRLAGNTVVVTGMSNLGLHRAMKANGIRGGSDRRGRPLCDRAYARKGFQCGRRAVGSHRPAGSRHHR